jgi:hypothetical protein
VTLDENRWSLVTSGTLELDVYVCFRDVVYLMLMVHVTIRGRERVFRLVCLWQIQGQGCKHDRIEFVNVLPFRRAPVWKDGLSVMLDARGGGAV